MMVPKKGSTIMVSKQKFHNDGAKKVPQWWYKSFSA